MATKADLEVAEEYNGELFAKLDRAASFIETSESIREQLLADRTTLADRLESGSGEQIKKLTAENDAIRAERDTAVAEAARVGGLEQDNADLATKLAAAEQRVERLAALDPEKEKIIADLRAELASVDGTLASLRQESADGRERIAELETQLEATATAAASATGAIAQENDLLKSIVNRQIRDQAKRQQARQLVEEEMEKLQVRSSTLIERLDALGEAETPLTAKEERLVRGPAEITSDSVATAGGLDFSMAIFKPSPGEAPSESDLPTELTDRAAAADARLASGDYAGAASIYDQLAAEAPDSYSAAVNLGIAELGGKRPREAIAAFDKAIAQRPGDSFATLQLGAAQLAAGDFDSARETLEQVVGQRPDSYEAHYGLGRVLQEQGEVDGAMTEMKKAIDLDPGRAQAHLSLAKLYASQQPPATEQVRTHYAKAIELGTSPDATIERLIR